VTLRQQIGNTIYPESISLHFIDRTSFQQRHRTIQPQQHKRFGGSLRPIHQDFMWASRDLHNQVGLAKGTKTGSARQ
jgi:hypothetical protein